MATVQFKLPIGAKRQVTIPRECMDLLSLEEGGELLLQIQGDHAVLLPVVSIPRRDLPEDLRKKFEARRGQKATDIPLAEFLGQIGYKTVKQPFPAEGASSGMKKRALGTAPAAQSSPLKMP
jgi:bifunctional DNA-binding transcriptional regulator/antitoxin component of YhaV-PrlF toxin-antitoxin module